MRGAPALLALLALALPAAAAPEMPARAWTAPESRPASLRREGPAATYRFTGTLPKAAADGDRRARVGFVLAAPKDFAAPAWHAVADGFVARFDVASAGAQGLRARLALSGTGPLEVRVRGAEGRVEAMAVAAGAGEAWGPWTGGDVQALEVFSRQRPADGAVRVAGVVHFDQPLEGKATAAACTVDAACSTGDAALDAAIAQRKASMARISFVDGGRAFVCTGTLLNTEKFPTPYFLTANHCIGRAEVAASITSFWFYEASACGSGALGAGSRQVAGGMAIDFADPNTDHTLLVMNASPPSGASFSGWNASKLANGLAVTSLSHPAGDVAKLALGQVDGMARFDDWEQSAWLVAYSRGIIQGGSSGSGLFTLSGGSLVLRGVLSASTTDPDGSLSCTNTDQRGVYNRLDVFYPQVARRLMANPPFAADDHGDRPAEATPVALGAAAASVAGRIDYAGDTDVFRFDVAAAGTLVVRASGGMDTVGVFLDGNGQRLASNDDAQTSGVDFGITERVSPGTYYLAVTRWESAGTGAYALSATVSPVTENYTDLWWNPGESGWGVNLNHQGGVIFATLYTYGLDGSPAWFSATMQGVPGGASYLGDLYRTRGPAFNASPWRPVTYERVGTMRVAFDGAGAGTLTYDVDGLPVTRAIERIRFSTPTTCAWSAFDRSYERNFQDLWWSPSEPGWGINFTHQGDILVGTIFTYGLDGTPRWFILSKGDRAPGTQRFEGALYQTAGPPFNASPWRTVDDYTIVGSMSVSFSGGNAGLLSYSVNGLPVSKPIERLAFGAPMPRCRSDD